MLSLYDFIYAVEPVDAWKPEANIYESGKMACAATRCFSGSHETPFASNSSFLTVSADQTKGIQRKESGFLLSL